MTRYSYAIAVAATLATAAQADIIIDAFDVPAAGQGVGPLAWSGPTSGNNLATGLPTTSVIGGSRDIAMALVPPPVPGSGSSSANATFTTGLLSIANSSQIDSMVTLSYNANGAGLAADLTDGGQAAGLEIGVGFADRATGIVMDVFAYSGANYTGSVASVTGVPVSNGLIQAPFVSFSNAGLLSNVGSLQVVFRALSNNGGWDLDVDYIQVPETSTYAAGAALAGLAGWQVWRRRRAAQA
jgi:hypothetical protein